MIAINHLATSNKYFAAVELLSALDLHRESAYTFVSRVAPFKMRDASQSFYKQMATARNLHTAAEEALHAASAHLLDSDSVGTFYVLAQSAVIKVLWAMDLAVREMGDTDNTVYYRDLFKSALEESQAVLRVIE